MPEQKSQTLPPSIDPEIIALLGGADPSGAVDTIRGGDAFDLEAANTDIARRRYEGLNQPAGTSTDYMKQMLQYQKPPQTAAQQAKLEAIQRKKERMGGKREWIGDMLAGYAVSNGGREADPIASFAKSFAAARRSRLLRESEMNKITDEEALIQAEMTQDQANRDYYDKIFSQYRSSGQDERLNEVGDDLRVLEGQRSLYPGRQANAEQTRLENPYVQPKAEAYIEGMTGREERADDLHPLNMEGKDTSNKLGAKKLSEGANKGEIESLKTRMAQREKTIAQIQKSGKPDEFRIANLQSANARDAESIAKLQKGGASGGISGSERKQGKSGAWFVKVNGQWEPE